MTPTNAFVVLALVCFVAGAAPGLQARVNLVSLGLAFLVIAYLLR